jgi:hypothetical protein
MLCSRGDYRGVLTLPTAFFGRRVFPVPVIHRRDTEIDCVAILGDWLRLRMTLPDTSESGSGTWRYGSMSGDVTEVVRVPPLVTR